MTHLQFALVVLLVSASSSQAAMITKTSTITTETRKTSTANSGDGSQYLKPKCLKAFTLLEKIKNKYASKVANQTESLACYRTVDNAELEAVDPPIQCQHLTVADMLKSSNSKTGSDNSFTTFLSESEKNNVKEKASAAYGNARPQMLNTLRAKCDILKDKEVYGINPGTAVKENPPTSSYGASMPGSSVKKSGSAAKAQ